MENAFEQPVGKWRCGKHIPEKSHREVFYDRSQPDGRQLGDRHSCGNYIKKDGSDKAHGRTHNGNCPCLAHDLTEIGVVFLRRAVTAGESRTYTVSP